MIHHALVNVLEPIYERTFIADSYACRKGKGTHAAVGRCQEFARRFRYVLKADIQKFFPSVDHAIAKELVARKVKDPHVLWLVQQIIDHSKLIIFEEFGPKAPRCETDYHLVRSWLAKSIARTPGMLPNYE